MLERIPPLIATALLTLSTAAFALNSGEHATGSITPIGDTDTYTFTAHIGENTRIGLGETNGISFAPMLSVQAPGGSTVGTNTSPSSAALAFQATESGTYTIFVSESGDDSTGDYDLNLAILPGAFDTSGDNGSLTNGLEQTGSIDLGDYDIWTFEAERGDTIRLGMGETSGSGYSPFLRLVAPNGATLTTSTGPDSTYIQTVAPTDGTYTAVASDSGKNDTGGHPLSLALLPYAFNTSGDNGILSNGVAINRSTDLGDFNLWVLSANAGDTLNLSLDELTGSGYSPFL